MNVGEWTDCEWPDLYDVGKMVQVDFGSFVAEGILAVDEFYDLENDGDVVPVFSTELSDGSRVGFAMNERWRFI